MRVVIAPAVIARVARGGFVRVDLDEEATLEDGATFRSVLIGRAGGAFRAYANVCRHHAIALDAEEPSPMADDGYHLFCHRHGAKYRPTDGVCIAGPCRGAALTALRIEVDEKGGVTVCIG